MPSYVTTFGERSSAPFTCGVFAILQGFEPLYVGSGSDVNLALRGLFKINGIQMLNTFTVQVWNCDSDSDRRQAHELYLIYALNLKYNIQIPDNFVETMLDYIKPDSKLIIEDLERFSTYFQKNKTKVGRVNVESSRRSEITNITYQAALSQLSDDELNSVEEIIKSIRVERNYERKFA